MNNADENERAAFTLARASLVLAGVFEVLTMPATQNNTIRAASPWREDPYHTMVSLAGFAVPMLALAIIVRLVVWRAPGGPDRAQQTIRAVGVTVALIALTLAFEWAAVIGTGYDRVSATWTGALVGGLILTSVLTVAATALLEAWRRQHGPSGRWRHDWLGDVITVCMWIPVLRRGAGPDVAAWIRRRAITVFLTLSVFAGAAFTGFQAAGEGWTDPLLIAWMQTVETASLFAFCVISNATVGFIARPSRSRTRRIAEASVVTGCLATLAAIGFHDALWRAVGSGPLNSVPDLVAVTLGTGLVVSLLTAACLLARIARPSGAAST